MPKVYCLIQHPATSTHICDPLWENQAFDIKKLQYILYGGLKILSTKSESNHMLNLGLHPSITLSQKLQMDFRLFSRITYYDWKISYPFEKSNEIIRS